jgi:hypothetical protein
MILERSLDRTPDSARHPGAVCPADLVVDTEAFSVAHALIESRSNVSPKRLVEPGPTARQLEPLLSLAAAAPDHGQLTPGALSSCPPKSVTFWPKYLPWP